MQINGLPVRVVAVIKRAAVDVELVAEDEVVLLTIEPSAVLDVLRRVDINDAAHAGDAADLAGAVHELEAGLVWREGEEGYDGINDEEHDDA